MQQCILIVSIVLVILQMMKTTETGKAHQASGVWVDAV